MSKKRVLTLLGLVLTACLLMASYGLFGLQSQEGKPEEGVLRVWVTWGDYPDQLQAMFDRYSQMSGQPVKVATGWRSNKILKAITGSTPPDVVILSSSDLVKTYYEQGLVEPLNPWIEATGIELGDIYPAPLAQCEMSDGTYLCLPWGSDVFALFWNKDLFEAAGLDPERPPQTMEELVEYAEKLTVRDEKGELSQMGFIPNFSRSHTDLYTRMFGGSWTNDDGTELMVNSQPMVEAANWQRQFYEKYGAKDVKQFVLSVNRYMNSPHPVYAGKRLNCQQCHRNAPRKGENIPDHGFYNGKVAMMVEGEWQLGPNYISHFQPELNYGVVAFPPPAGHPERANTAVVEGPVVIIPAGVKDKEAAAKLLAWMMSPEIVAEEAYANSNLPTSRTAAQDPRFQQIPNFKIFMDLMTGANAKPIITTPISFELNQALGEVEGDVLYKGGDPVPLLNEVQTEFVSKLK